MSMHKKILENLDDFDRDPKNGLKQRRETEGTGLGKRGRFCGKAELFLDTFVFLNAIQARRVHEAI